MSAISVEIGNRIREARKEKKMTQGDLAAKLDMTAAALSRYELGQRNITSETVRKIAAALDVPTAVLMGEPISPKVVDGYDSTIGKRILKEAQRRGISEAELAVQVGEEEYTIHSFSSTPDCDWGPNLATLMKYADIFGIFWADLVDDDIYAADIWSFSEGYERIMAKDIQEMRRKFYDTRKDFALWGLHTDIKTIFLTLNPIEQVRFLETLQKEQDATLKDLQSKKTPIPHPKPFDSEKMQRAREAFAELHLDAPADDTDTKNGGQ